MCEFCDSMPQSNTPREEIVKVRTNDLTDEELEAEVDRRRTEARRKANLQLRHETLDRALRVYLADFDFATIAGIEKNPFTRRMIITVDVSDE